MSAPPHSSSDESNPGPAPMPVEVPVPRRLHVVEHPALDAPDSAHPRVVLVHGAMDRASSFARVAKRLRDVAVVTYDRRGYAASAAIGPSTSFDDQVTDLLGVIGGIPSVVAGHSFGGNVVLAAAARAPELVNAAVVFEPPAPWLEWWPSSTRRAAATRTPEDTAEDFMRRMVGNRIWDHLPARTRQQRRSEGAALVAELVSVGDERPYAPGEVAIPVVVGWGTDSPSHMPRAARILAGELPDVIGVEVAGSSHGVHLSHPADFVALIRLAISRLPHEPVARPRPGGG